MLLLVLVLALIDLGLVLRMTCLAGHKGRLLVKGTLVEGLVLEGRFLKLLEVLLAEAKKLGLGISGLLIRRHFLLSHRGSSKDVTSHAHV